MCHAAATGPGSERQTTVTEPRQSVHLTKQELEAFLFDKQVYSIWNCATPL